MPNASQRPPRHADCRGGVFAMRRFPRPLPPYAHPMPHMAMGGFYNDAARRVVIRLHVSHLWGPMVFITPRHGKGGHSLRSAPPLPSAQLANLSN